MIELNVNNTHVAKKAGVSRQTWYRLLNAEIQEAKISTLVQVADALETHVILLLRLYFSHLSSKDDGVIDKPLKPSINSSVFVKDINYPLNSSVFTGQTFTKTWRVANLGKKTWDGVFLKCVSAESPANMQQWCLSHSHNEIMVTPTKPAESIDVSVDFTAPLEPCTVMSEWKLADENGFIDKQGEGALRCIVRVVGV